MKSEIKILLDEKASNKAKGNCFEDLIRNLLNIQHFSIRGNINFGGMEIDLVAEHKHTKESLYVECKAKEKVSSDELSKFCFNADFKEVDKGYFFRTQELESQAGALLSDIRNKPKYKKFSFFEPKEIIQMLKDGKMIYEPTEPISKFLVSKQILAVTYIGDFFVYLINETNALPTKFIVVNAKNNNQDIEAAEVDLLQTRIDEIANLSWITNFRNYKATPEELLPENIETISEVQESENWYDYLPASSDKKHFIGRDDIRTKILSFFKQVHDNSTQKRIFYLNGKSGWGKSSLVLELKGRCGNKHFKNRFFALAIDTRSAISDNFVAISFKKLITDAINKKFVASNLFTRDLAFTSNNDILSSNSIKEFLDILKTQNKFLVLIFDQFEDVFRKRDFFKTFYKFLTDVTDTRPNLIIGFSWKSDFFIQSDDPSYHIWQQAKEQAREFTIKEFGEKEIDGIIKQLEESVGDLGYGIKERIKESSQGLPWLTKKLCIHIFDQIESGVGNENLVESNLNILELFKKDEERVSSSELRALKIIAKRAYEGDFFDEAEVGDVIDTATMVSLLHKRLIIRSGANYNIYWDIYRDYLVTGQIPLIGESYLLRQGVNLCLEVFLLFSEGNNLTLDSLLLKHPKGIGQETLYNILIELRNLGIVQKIDDFYIVNDGIEITKPGFTDFITNKFQKYTPYIKLKKNLASKITKNDIIQTLKSTFKQEFQDNTWDVYAKNIISWFLLSNLDIKHRIIEPTKGRSKSGLFAGKFSGSLDFALPKASLKEMLGAISSFYTQPKEINPRFNRELYLLEIIKDGQLTPFGTELISCANEERIIKLRNKVLELPKILKVKSEVDKRPKMTSQQLVDMYENNFFDGNTRSSKLIYASKVLSWLRS